MLKLSGSKNPPRKGKSVQSNFKNDLIIDGKFPKLVKKYSNVIDFIKQKDRFIFKNSYDIKGTREFLASKEVAMRAIKLNDEIIEEEKINEWDSELDDIYLTNDINKFDKIKNRVGKQISNTHIKSKSKSNKELIELNMKKFKKELKNIKDNEKESKNLSIRKKNRRSKKNIKESVEQKNKVESPNQIIKIRDHIGQFYSVGKKMESSTAVNKQIQTHSQFLFSEVNKKLMVDDDDINISGIIDIDKSPKVKSNSKIKETIFSTCINNNKTYKPRSKRKSNVNILEENKSNNKDKESIKFNSDKESLLSILSDLM